MTLVTTTAASRSNLSRALHAWHIVKAEAMRRRSQGVVTFLSLRMDRIATLWICLAAAVAVPKIALALTPVHDIQDIVSLALPYLGIMAAPMLGYWAAAGSFSNGILAAQPRFRLAFYGRWRRISVLEASRDPRFGPTGFMASLLIGMILNVPLRLLEFATAVPAMNSHAPMWGRAIFLSMAGEVCVMSFLYMACFVMALRNIPLFPRMLAFVWAADLYAQFAIADLVSKADGLPATVATALQALLTGNINKVMISVVVWLPYLLLSERVNVTYRLRAPMK